MKKLLITVMVVLGLLFAVKSSPRAKIWLATKTCGAWPGYLKKCNNYEEEKKLLVIVLVNAKYLEEKYKSIDVENISNQVIWDGIYNNYSSFQRITRDDFETLSSNN